MLIVLDLDDTLYLERDYVRSGFEAAERVLAAERPDLASGFAASAWAHFEAGGRHRVFGRLLAARGCHDAALIARLVQAYRSHRPAIRLLADARDFLDRARGHDLALLTDGPVEAQRAKIAALGLDRLVPRILITDAWDKRFRKPYPRAYRQLAAGRLPRECLAIGDNPAKDFVVPLALGWQQPVRVRRPGSLHAAVPTPEGCREVTSLAEVDLRTAGEQSP